MDETIILESVPKIDGEYQEAIERYLEEMENLNAQMMDRQKRIQQLQAETEAILADLKVA